MATQRRPEAGHIGSSVAHVTTNHQPFDTRVFLKESRTLAAAGYLVHLVVPHDADLDRDGVRIRAIPRPRSRSDRWLSTGRHALRAALSTGAGTFHLHDPDLLPYGWVLKLLGKKVVYDAHENRPLQVMSKTWIPAVLRRPVAWVTRAVEVASAALFDLVVAATPEIAATFPPNKTVLVQNFPLSEEFAAVGNRPFTQRGAKVAFVGGITAIRGAREMVSAMSLLPPELEARLQLAGPIAPPSLLEELKALPGVRATDVLGTLTREEVAALLADARMGLVLYHPEPNHVGAQPNKLFEYMSAGLPVIASDFPLWRQIVERSNCGLLVDPLDARAIAAAIEWLLRNPAEAEAMGARGRRAVLEELNWETQASALLGAYQRLDA